MGMGMGMGMGQAQAKPGPMGPAGGPMGQARPTGAAGTTPPTMVSNGNKTGGVTTSSHLHAILCLISCHQCLFDLMGTVPISVF